MDEFLGTFTPRLDDKGRLFLPARFRAALAGGLVVTTGQEGCLYVYPTAEFHRISGLMQSAPGSSRGSHCWPMAQGRRSAERAGGAEGARWRSVRRLPA